MSDREQNRLEWLGVFLQVPGALLLLMCLSERKSARPQLIVIGLAFLAIGFLFRAIRGFRWARCLCDWLLMLIAFDCMEIFTCACVVFTQRYNSSAAPLIIGTVVLALYVKIRLRRWLKWRFIEHIRKMCADDSDAGDRMRTAFSSLRSILGYIAIAFINRSYGEVMLNALYYLPTQFVGMYVWSRHYDREDGQVEGKRMAPRFVLLRGAASVAAAFACKLVLDALGGSAGRQRHAARHHEHGVLRGGQRADGGAPSRAVAALDRGGRHHGGHVVQDEPHRGVAPAAPRIPRAFCAIQIARGGELCYTVVIELERCVERGRFARWRKL